MNYEQEHLIYHMHEVITGVMLASVDANCNTNLAQWHGISLESATKFTAGPDDCRYDAALMLIHLMARRLYDTPEECRMDTAALIAPMALGEYVP